MRNNLVIVRGGGDLATGSIYKLWSAGFSVLVLETDYPSAIRRQVSVCEAVYLGSISIEDMTAVRITELSEAEAVWNEHKVPVLVDPDGRCCRELKPLALVDAIIAKQNLGTTRQMAPLTIALGPGFTAGADVDYVIETSRGHNLGRIISAGTAKPNSGIPGNIGGYTKERVIHSPAAGIVKNTCQIGDVVEAGEEICRIVSGDTVCPVPATITGILRGLIRDDYPVTEGFKIADIDPRQEELANCFTISDKARCIAGGVLELVCREYMKQA